MGKKSYHVARPFPRKIYRFLDQQVHAERLLCGYVWISTVKWLRETDRARGDREEATLLYYPGDIDTDVAGDHTAQQLRNLSKLGFHCGPGGTLKMNFGEGDGFEVAHDPPNGFVFCSSTASPTAKLRGAFGNFCVKISDVERFVQIMSRSMARYAGEWQAGRIDYSGRVYRGASVIPDSGTLFLGPAGNAAEAEYRMFWSPRSEVTVEPFELYAPEVAHLCSIA